MKKNLKYIVLVILVAVIGVAAMYFTDSKFSKGSLGDLDTDQPQLTRCQEILLNYERRTADSPTMTASEVDDLISCLNEVDSMPTTTTPSSELTETEEEPITSAFCEELREKVDRLLASKKEVTPNLSALEGANLSNCDRLVGNFQIHMENQ